MKKERIENWLLRKHPLTNIDVLVKESELKYWDNYFIDIKERMTEDRKLTGTIR